MTNKERVPEAQAVCKELEDFTERFTPWESGFFTSVVSQMDNEDFCTERQLEILEKMYSKYLK